MTALRASFFLEFEVVVVLLFVSLLSVEGGLELLVLFIPSFVSSSWRRLPKLTSTATTASSPCRYTARASCFCHTLRLAIFIPILLWVGWSNPIDLRKKGIK